MKKSQTILTLMAMALIVTGFAGCAPQENTNTAATNANMATPVATPDNAAIQTELTRIENDWPRVLKERDTAAVQRVEADDVVLIYPDGSLGSKQRDVSDIGSGSLTADSWDVSEIQVKVIDNDSAVVSLRTNVINGKYKMADGRSQNISGQFRSLDTFARRNGQWQVVASVTVPVANPTSMPAAKTSPAESPTTKPSPMVKPSPAPRSSPAVRSATPTGTP